MGSSESKVEHGCAKSQPKPYGFPYEVIIPSLLANSNHSLIEKNNYSDLLIICGHDRYLVHRAIVCPRSTWFADRCEEAIQGSDYVSRIAVCEQDYTSYSILTQWGQSSPSSQMKIWMEPGEDSHIVAAVLTFLYSLDYADSGPQLQFGLPQDQISFFSDDSTVEAHEERPDAERMEKFREGDGAQEQRNLEQSPLLTPSMTTDTPSLMASENKRETGSDSPNQSVLHTRV